jgi:hypothetical protein
MATRQQNERTFPQWDELPGGGRIYFREMSNCNWYYSPIRFLIFGIALIAGGGKFSVDKALFGKSGKAPPSQPKKN